MYDDDVISEWALGRSVNTFDTSPQTGPLFVCFVAIFFIFFVFD